jgi:hypothetical protein
MVRSSLRWTIPTFLSLQLGLLWIQGAQIHRQNQVLQGLREDIQSLADAIDNGQSSGTSEDETTHVPARYQAHAPVEEQDPAAKELQAARESAQKAVKDAREAQSKLSIEENIQKVEEAKKLQSATSEWQSWVWGAMALVALALIWRAFLRRRA